MSYTSCLVVCGDLVAGAALFDVVREGVVATPAGAILTPELSDGDIKSFNAEKTCAPSIVGVFTAGGQTYIAGRVIPIVVNAVEIQFWIVPTGERNGVAQPDQFVRNPRRIDRYASATIVRVGFMFRVITPGDCTASSV